MRMSLRVNGTPAAVDVHPVRRLLDVLRDDLGLCGTKEGCGEGECGACTVLLDGEAVNSCLLPACQADGRDVVTIEGGGHEHVQRAFLSCGGAQCGICTPGMVLMARAWLGACARTGETPTAVAARAALAGNLCRCTGYVKIVDSVLAAAGAVAPVAGGSGTTARTAGLRTSLPDVLAALAERPVRLLAGGTDLMVERAAATDAREETVDLWPLAELRGVRREGAGVRLGALTTCTELLDVGDDVPGADLLRATAREFAAVQIRNRATLGGNLATASPASDLAPVLLVLGAVVRLRSAAGSRDVSIAEFFTGYRRTARRAGELIESVWLPDRPAGERRVVRKVGTRAAQAIAKVAVALRLRMEGGRIASIEAAAASVAERPVLLPSVRALVGREASAEVVAAVARQVARTDVRPIDDVRSTAAYRRNVLARVLHSSIVQAAADAG